MNNAEKKKKMELWRISGCRLFQYLTREEMRDLKLLREKKEMDDEERQQSIAGLCGLPKSASLIF